MIQPLLKGVVLSGLVAALSACNSAGTNSVGAGSVTVTSSIALSSKAKADLQEFSDLSRYYGAFYVTSNGKGWGWQGGSDSLAEARRLAEAFCKAHNPGRSCQLYATLSPKDPNATRGVSVLTSERIEEIERKTKGGNWGALYATPDRQSGSSWDFATKEAADDRALLECQDIANHEFAKASSVEKKVHRMVGLFDCERVGFYR